MNFTQEIKRELLKNIPKEPCCRRAALFGMLSACAAERAQEAVFTTEREEIAAFALESLERLGEKFELTKASFDPKKGQDKLSFAVRKELCNADLEEVTKKDCCKESFLKGAFLGGGSCTLPKEGKKTGYHLEVNFEREEGERTFSYLCEYFQLLPPNVFLRGDKRKAYFKSREAIADFLALLGAEGALKTLEEVSSLREEMNRENRKGNCFAGNADKAAIASAFQVLAIEKLMSEGAFSGLSEELKVTARARLENPELSLTELSQKLSISKSCLYHRIQKILSLSGKNNA